MGATLSSRQPAFKLENWCENSCEDCLKIVLRTRDELQGTAIHHLPSEEALRDSGKKRGVPAEIERQRYCRLGNAEPFQLLLVLYAALDTFPLRLHLFARRFEPFHYTLLVRHVR